MTPAEHLAEAEKLLPLAYGFAMQQESGLSAAFAAVAQGHIQIAIAAEIGVPHSGPGGGGDSAQAHPAAG